MRVLSSSVALVVAGAVGLSGCGGGSSSSSSAEAVQTSSSTAGASASAHNDQDASFASQMTGHHAQAITMSKLAATRAASSQVKDLAARIEGAQQPEIAVLTRMLSGWGEAGNDSGMAMMGQGTDGMASKAQLAKLRRAKGTAFDRLFLTLMMAHHRGAITMSQVEQKAGKSVQAVALAARIRAEQSGEIEEMAALLKNGTS